MLARYLVLRIVLRLLLPAASLIAAGCSDDPTPPIADTSDVGVVDIVFDVAPPDVPDSILDVTPDTTPVDIIAPDIVPPPPPYPVRAFLATHPQHLVGGPKAEGALGDFVIESDERRYIIENIRKVGGYRNYGGNLVDMGLGGHSEDDNFGELWFGWNLLLFSPETAEIVSDGVDGVAHVRLTGRTAPYPWVDSFIRPLLNPPVAPLHLTYDYRLRPNEPFIELTITVLNDGPSTVDVEYPFALINQGDGVKVWIPTGVGFSGLMGQQGVRHFGAVGYERSYGIYCDFKLTGLFAYANMELAAHPIHTIAPNESRIMTVAYAATVGGSGAIAQIEHDYFDGAADGFVQGEVLGFDATTWVAIFHDNGIIGVTPVDGRGRFRMTAPVGIWNARAYNGGLRSSTTASIRSRTMDPPFLSLTMPEASELVVNVVDQDGNWIPAQVTLTAQTSGIAAPPEHVQLVRTGRLGDNALIYATTPDFRITTQPGQYRVTVSRGYTYDLKSLTETVNPGESKRLDVVLAKMVDTTDWIAGDFHLHGWWSSDSEVPYDVRVRQAAANDISLPVLTEHAYIGDLDEAALDAGLDDWVAAIPAQEVTTFEYGHFNAFPMVYDPLAPSGGAVFEHGRPGNSLFGAIRTQSDKDVLIQINHPRELSIGFGYFQLVGLNAKTRTVRDPLRWTEDFDLIEVFNGTCLDKPTNLKALDDWIALTNAGLTPTLGSGSDSHTEAGGVGHPRSWVEVDLAAVSLDPQAIVAPLKDRRSFVSCGPFVRFRTSDGVGIGGRATVDASGAVAFAVSVEAPPWMGLSEALLRENGNVIARIAIGAPGSVDAARPGLRLNTAFTARPAKDAWYALEVIGRGTLPFPFQADRPYALTNAIEVDANRDGAWTPPGN